MMYLINGQHKQHVPVSDRGFQYGDGLFETIEIVNSTPVFLDLHLKRLQQGCQRLSIPCPDIDLLTDEIDTFCKNHTHAVLKIIITRGSGGRGYRQPDIIQPTRLLALYTYPEYLHPYEQIGVKVRFCSTRLGTNPSLAGIKHLNRLEQILARNEWHDPDIQEGIMLDANDKIIEGTMSNLFFFKNDVLYTPSLLQSGVEGIIRTILLQEFQDAVISDQIDENELLSADEIFICNSVIGIWPVIELAEKRFEMGAYTKQVQKKLALRKSEDLKNEI